MAKRSKNIDIEGLFFNIKEKPFFNNEEKPRRKSEPSSGASMPAAAGRANWSARFTLNCAGLAHWQAAPGRAHLLRAESAARRLAASEWVSTLLARRTQSLQAMDGTLRLLVRRIPSLQAIDGTLRLLARRIPSLRVYGEGPGHEFRLCFCLVKIHVSSATYNMSSSSQMEQNSGQLSNAPKTSVCKVPAAQSYLDGGGAQARQCCYPRCPAACTADACNAAAA